ncbi:Oidioi.mRNA.OKI2018_I69.chr1.g1796.t1.cds [Oikopleura dioica]|nr:Oidioi.mRNA.OKI2018_I69.PAR.g9077.t1.cds [Oikopleura dioica]CAG5088916.1 Oidioi.mRNA.OKI2018_I69.PAR.g12011.t1.cds [Oikopleura dioica]CAG5105059.1 Oidioi.mRNA.OKI2018_I69.chr1.g1796.t1.cds [Oikopleura dioica]
MGVDKKLDYVDAPQSYEADSETFARHNILCEKKGLWTLPADYPQTILECFQRGRETANYTTRTYGEFAATSQYLANSLKKHGLISGESKIAIYSSNCYEYDAVIIGGYYQNICNVSLYDTFGEQAVKYILEHIEAPICFVQNQKKLDLILKIKPAHLQTIVVFRKFKKVKSSNYKIISFDDFIAIGKDSSFDNVPPTSSDIATINYTSDTTGDPKGVVLTHKNICTVCCGITIFSVKEPWKTSDVWFSYLPMANIF